MTHSALYVGRVAHARRAPRPHAFRYGLYMLYLDLDELPALGLGWLFGVERPGLASFRRRDYLGDPARPLREAVLDRVEAELGTRPTGPVRMLSQVRTLGYVFNPVTFYYCFAADGRSLEAVAAEITNTPWGELHTYVLRAVGDHAEASFAKAFHVSPFFPMEQRYHWRFSAPADELGVHMRSEQAGREVFRADLTLRRQPLERAGLARAVLRQPSMSASIHLAIYLQAFRLWCRRTPFFAHPRSHTP
jgi:DUF1365 family protein